MEIFTKNRVKEILLCCFLIIQFYGYSQNTKSSDTSLTISNIRVDILFPDKPAEGTIMVLPGWNFKCDDICKKSNFCELAKNENYVLIMPDMLKSVYQSKVFPETREDWKHYPTLTWVTDTLIPYVQKKFKLLLPGQNNFLFGISTGGRGVAMLALYTTNIFKAGASLSGDYNQLMDLEDNLMKGYYGPYEKFPERWSGKDNPEKNAEQLKIPLFLAHGKADNIVPCSQTIDFYNTISKLKPELGHKIVLNDTASHNYGFWQSEYSEALKFFKRHKISDKNTNQNSKR